ncbi:MAG: vWA domain-containing protein [Acutalibacteraceae bacterium]|nr:vWA domain-containing protein [Acutalibacteraceae bacterium]
MNNKKQILMSKYLKQITTEIKREIPKVVRRMSGDLSVYRYLIAQRPVVADEQLPAFAHKQMQDHNNSPAFTTGDYVAFSSENLALLLIEHAVKRLDALAETLSESEYLKNLETSFNRIYNDNWQLQREIGAILAHEYTHILCEHQKFSYRFASKKHTRRDFVLWQYAMEIQANDAIDLNHNTAVYESGFTRALCGDTLTNCYTLGAIYKALKNDKKLSDKINDKHNQANNEQPQNAPQSVDADADDDNNADNEQPQDTDTDNSGNTQAESTTTTTKAEDDDEKLSDAVSRVAQSIENDIEEAEYEAEHEAEQNDDTDEPTTEVVDDGNDDVDDVDNDAGHSPASVEATPAKTVKHNYDVDADEANDNDVENKTVQELADRYNDRQIAKRLAKQFAKLRQTIKGDMSKNKTKTYSRPSRRGSYNGLFRKGIKRDTRSVPKVLVALDCSGSMSSAKVTAIANTIGTIVNELGRSNRGSYICLHNDDVRCLVPLSDWQTVVRQYQARGGNNFTRVYQKAQELDVNVVLNVGDGLDYLYGHDKRIVWYDVIVDYDDTYESRAIADCNDANNQARKAIIVDKRV